MNTARIVVLTVAVGAVSGATACAARGVVSSGPSSGEPAPHLLGSASRTSDPLAPALNALTDSDILQSSARGDRSFRRGDNINVTTQK